MSNGPRTSRSTAAPSTGARAVPGSIGALGEFSLIESVTQGRAYPEHVELGPGDDAAVLRAADGRVLVSTDVLVEGVHFRADWASGEQIGRRAALAAMADIAAMGGHPTALVVGLSAPADTPADLLLALGRGLHDAAEEVGAAVIGGDVTKSGVLTVAVTVLGDLRGVRPVVRSGARAGDLVAVAGRLGWAAAGLTILSRGFRSPAALVNAYRVPEPPLSAGPVAADSGATSMIDVSDGLLADLGHVARASEVSINLRTVALDINPRLVEVGSALGKDPLDWVLAGGDDHALVATFPHGASLPPGWQPIGEVLTAGADGPVVTVDGDPREGSAGWDHFSS